MVCLFPGTDHPVLALAAVEHRRSLGSHESLGRGQSWREQRSAADVPRMAYGFARSAPPDSTEVRPVFSSCVSRAGYFRGIWIQPVAHLAMVGTLRSSEPWMDGNPADAGSDGWQRPA